MKVLLNQRQRKILEILSRENGCITSLEISKNLSISSKTVQNEIVAMEITLYNQKKVEDTN